MLGLDNLKTRLNYHGGTQEHRMQRDKLNTFHKSLLYSYQAADILFPYEGRPKRWRCLINPDKTKQNYDDKILSIDFDANIQPGDVFYWENTNTYWIVYLESLEEDVYFRGEIRRCRYNIKFKLDDEVYSVPAAVRGPVETKIIHEQKHNISHDAPNETLDILIPQNEYTLAFFKRYTKFMLGGICWQVQTTDYISMRGIIQMTAKENFVDEFKDTEDLVDGLVEPIPEDPGEIAGPQFIELYEEYTYNVPSGTGYRWIIRPKGYVEIVGDYTSDSITIKPLKAGNIMLYNGVNEENFLYSKPIRIETLF